MSKLETVMWCLAYALGRNPSRADIHRAKTEPMNVKPECVNTVISSTELLLAYMSEQEIATYKRHFCTCTLSAVSYRIEMQVHECDNLGYYICPRCRTPFDREYQAYCDACGQHLAW